jgi:hypothetical protein
MMVVLPPRVMVCVGGEKVVVPQTMGVPELVVVSAAPMMEVVPFSTLKKVE